ncbi:MAG: hypothetical protein HRU33_15690 [Rhodobacteraceae bacterium]|nr:hypothetical protein [Paracoccaceae bacterium]
MESLNIETVLATGAQETATGSRLALRGMIWFAYGFHMECNMGDTKPAAYNRKVKGEPEDFDIVEVDNTNFELQED